MGECFFWYRPTRVVPDQRPLNGRCCCCCCAKRIRKTKQTQLIFIHRQKNNHTFNVQPQKYANVTNRLDCLLCDCMDRKWVACVRRCLTIYTSTCVRRLDWSSWQWNGRTACMLLHLGSPVVHRLRCFGVFSMMR